MSRTLPLLVGIVALLAGLAAGALWLLGDRGQAQEPSKEPDAAAVETPVDDGPTDVKPRKVHANMPGVYPWREFQEDFNLLMRPETPGPGPDGGMHPTAVTANTMAETKFTVRLSDATMNEVIAELGRQAEGTGVRIYTREPYFSDTMRYDVHLSDKNLFEIYGYLMDMTRNQLKSFTGDGEICLGTTLAVMRAREDATKRSARDREAREAQTDVLDATFRPDFDGADAEKVVLNMTAQTGVQVLMHELVWEKHLTMTWRTGEMTLRKALRELCKKLEATFRVYEERVYIVPYVR